LITTNELDKDKFVEINLDVFEGVGCFPDVYSLKLNEEIIPKARIARRVPIKIKDRSKIKLEELVEKKK